MRSFFVCEMKITIVLPTYNEADNLPKMVSALLALSLNNLSIVIVDDNSPDGTGKVADELAQGNRDRITVIHREGKSGLGTAYIEGFTQAIQGGADVIVQMDCDFSHSPSYIPHMIDQTKSYDVVVGSRYVPGGKVDERWEFGRYLLSWFANSLYTRIILGISTHDTTAGFKAWKRDTLLGIGLDRVHSNGYVFQVEMAYITEKLGYRVLELPIYFEDRRIGKSKMSIPVKLEAAIRTWQVRMRHGGLSPKDRRTF